VIGHGLDDWSSKPMGHGDCSLCHHIQNRLPGPCSLLFIDTVKVKATTM